MRATGRFIGWLAGAAVAVAGCRTMPPAPPDPVTAPPSPTVLPVGQPASLEPDYAGLPLADPVAESVAPAVVPGTPYLQLTETACRDLAAEHSPEARLIRQVEPSVPQPTTHRRRSRDCPPPSEDAVRALRELAAADARNSAAADALEQFYRLADSEGRGELLRATLPLLDELRAAIKKARAEGVRVPTDPAELDRQRGQLLAVIGQADLGTALLNIDLKRRIGVDGRDPGRLRSTGPFPMSDVPVEPEAAVQVALQRRPDLQLLRTAYHRWDELSAEDQQSITGGRRWLDRLGPAQPRLLSRDSQLTRQQVFDLTATSERAAADEVRAAAANLNAQTRQVGLARWRADHLTAEAEKAKKNGPLAELPAQVEAIRARAEVVAAGFTWQQARVKLLAAQGAFAGTP